MLRLHSFEFQLDVEFLEIYILDDIAAAKGCEARNDYIWQNTDKGAE
jgi:hypothetical protein